MSKVYKAKVLAVDCFGDAIIEIPEEMVKELDWRIGDELDYKLKGESVIITNLTKEKRSGS